jgi:acetylornithine deacetylase/succinyl-diaminopimelate desuccinylase-like protein
MTFAPLSLVLALLAPPVVDESLLVPAASSPPAGVSLPATTAPVDLVPPPQGEAPAGFDREDAAARTLAHLQALIAIDSTNAQDPASLGGRPNGNELEVAEWFEATCTAAFGDGFEQVDAEVSLEGEGSYSQRSRTWGRVAGVTGPSFTTHVLEVAPHRANFIARLASPAPTAQPVLVMGHMDVVGADPARWSTAPFEAVIQDGYVMGRGAIDCKGPLAAELTAFLTLATQRESLTRDVILFATAAEEGGPGLGVGWMLEHSAHLLGEPEFALNEGGRVRLGDGRVRSVNIQTTEKVPYNVTVTAAGPSGHGSVPLPDNALAALARAVSRVHDWRAPARLNDTTRKWLIMNSRLQDDERLAGAMVAAASSNGSGPSFDAAIDALDNDPMVNAVLRAGASLTMIDGGFRSNVIPSDGQATFNLRVLPDDDVEALVAAMQEAGGEEAVTFTLNGSPRKAPPPSPTDTALYQSMERAASQMSRGVVVLPFMSTGATDGAALRRIGIPTYGILPIPLLPEDELRMHGDDERAPVSGLGWAAEFIYRSLAGVATG